MGGMHVSALLMPCCIVSVHYCEQQMGWDMVQFLSSASWERDSRSAKCILLCPVSAIFIGALAGRQRKGQLVCCCCSDLECVWITCCSIMLSPWLPSSPASLLFCNPLSLSITNLMLAISRLYRLYVVSCFVLWKNGWFRLVCFAWAAGHAGGHTASVNCPVMTTALCRPRWNKKIL